MNHGLIWFGAAISITEIIAGAFIAPLGIEKGIIAILLGHIIGGVVFYIAGLIGAKTGKCAMESVKNSFGQKGALFFSGMNILQLIGWTAVMIATGATTANSIFNFSDERIWSIIMGGLIIIWILNDVREVNKLSIVSGITLFVLTLILSKTVFNGNVISTSEGVMTFGGAVELSVAMPLSWLPLISDYTFNAKQPKKASLISAIVYFLASSWMYIIGLGAAIYTGGADIAVIMNKVGLGVIALIIVILSTVTTTFLDVYSAGMSIMVFSKKYTYKKSAIIVCILGTILVMFISMAQYESFLYLISSIFAPMIAIQIVDNFILKKDFSDSEINIYNFGIWIVGFGVYQLFMKIETPVGNSVPVMLITGILCYVINKIFRGEKKCLEI